MTIKLMDISAIRKRLKSSKDKKFHREENLDRVSKGIYEVCETMHQKATDDGIEFTYHALDRLSERFGVLVTQDFMDFFLKHRNIQATIGYHEKDAPKTYEGRHKAYTNSLQVQRFNITIGLSLNELHVVAATVYFADTERGERGGNGGIQDFFANIMMPEYRVYSMKKLDELESKKAKENPVVKLPLYTQEEFTSMKETLETHTGDPTALIETACEVLGADGQRKALVSYLIARTAISFQAIKKAENIANELCRTKEKLAAIPPRDLDEYIKRYGNRDTKITHHGISC